MSQLSQLAPLLSRLRSLHATWFTNFRYQTFFLTILSACGLAKEVCEWAGVQHDAIPFVVGAFAAATGFSFILNPKSTDWVADAKKTVQAVRSGNYDAALEAVPELVDPMDEAHDTDPDAQLPLPFGDSTPSTSTQKAA